MARPADGKALPAARLACHNLHLVLTCTSMHLQEHLFLVCELLRANLYEFQKYNRENGDEPYFTLPRLQRIAHQVSVPYHALLSVIIAGCHHCCISSLLCLLSFKRVHALLSGSGYQSLAIVCAYCFQPFRVLASVRLVAF